MILFRLLILSVEEKNIYVYCLLSRQDFSCLLLVMMFTTVLFYRGWNIRCDEFFRSFSSIPGVPFAKLNDSFRMKS